MKNLSDFKIGDLVFIRGYMSAGEVVKICPGGPHEHLVVRWDDGSVGIMFSNPKQTATIQNLHIADQISIPAVKSLGGTEGNGNDSQR